MLRNRAFVKMTKSQQSVGQHELDMAFIRERLEEELRSLHTEKTTNCLNNKLSIVLAEVSLFKEAFGQLKSRVASYDNLKEQVLSCVGKICSQYENCISEMRFKLSLMEDDLADTNKRLAMKNGQIESLGKQLEEFKYRFYESQSNFNRLKALEKSQDAENQNQKAQSEQEIASLNIRMNELLMIVHERNNRVNCLEAQLKSIQHELSRRNFALPTSEVLLPTLASKVQDNFSKTIENINVLAVKQCSSLKVSQQIREPFKGSQTMRITLDQNINTTTVLTSPKKDLKQLNKEVMERMQSFISEMTLTHRAKAESLASYRKKQKSKEQKQQTISKVNQKWFSGNSKQGQKIQISREYLSRR